MLFIESNVATERDKSLIEAVREYPYLYNSHSSEYSLKRMPELLLLSYWNHSLLTRHLILRRLLCSKNSSHRRCRRLLIAAIFRRRVPRSKVTLKNLRGNLSIQCECAVYITLISKFPLRLRYFTLSPQCEAA